MATATKTLKLPFHRLNQAKAGEFERLQALNTAVANTILNTGLGWQTHAPKDLARNNLARLHRALVRDQGAETSA